MYQNRIFFVFTYFYLRIPKKRPTPKNEEMKKKNAKVPKFLHSLNKLTGKKGIKKKRQLRPVCFSPHSAKEKLKIYPGYLHDETQ
jgi:hypothetical protein